MRRDVRYGTVLSMIIVLVVGGLWLFRTEPEQPIPLTNAAGDAARGPSREPATTTPRRTPAPGARTVNSQPSTRPSGPNRASLPPSGTVGTARSAGESGSTAPAAFDSPTRVAGGQTRDAALPGPTNRPQPATGDPRAMETSGVTAPSTPSPRIADATTPPGVSAESSPADQPAVSSASPQNSAPRPGPNPVMLTSRKPSTTGSTPGPAVAAQPAAVETHRVQPGDTLSSLAQAYYGSERFVSLLREANTQVDDPAVLRVGSVIRIPPAPTPGADSAATSAAPVTGSRPVAKRTYEVKSGDSFYAIARDQLGNAARWKELLALNHDLVKGDPTRLRPGQVVVLPES